MGIQDISRDKCLDICTRARTDVGTSSIKLTILGELSQGKKSAVLTTLIGYSPILISVSRFWWAFHHKTPFSLTTRAVRGAIFFVRGPKYLIISRQMPAFATGMFYLVAINAKGSEIKDKDKCQKSRNKLAQGNVCVL